MTSRPHWRRCSGSKLHRVRWGACLTKFWWRIQNRYMHFPLYQVDAFTAVPFGGNPAAVCILPEARDEVWMQHVAAEMNLAETAFLERRDDGLACAGSRRRSKSICAAMRHLPARTRCGRTACCK